MEQSNLPPERPSLVRIHRTLDRIAPILWPTIAAVAIISVLLLGAFLWLVAQHFPIGVDRLDMSNTGNVGEFIGGTIGTALSAVGSLLLVLTLWVQINEYKLTREELVNSVNAQRSMAKTQAEQLQPLRDQAKTSKQALEMDLLTRAVLDLKDDIRSYSAKPWTDSPGYLNVAAYMTDNWKREKGWLYIILDTNDENSKSQVIQFTALTLIDFYLIVERAVLVLEDLDTKELPHTSRTIRRKELILHVKKQLVPMAGDLWGLRVQLDQVPEKDPLYKRFKVEGLDRIRYIVDRLMEFMRMDVAGTNGEE